MQRRLLQILCTFNVLAFLTMPTSASTLQLDVFNAGSEAIFPVTSTLIYGDREAVLVDAQFQKGSARRLVDKVKALNKELRYVFISHSDPDYYFGLDEVRKAFPAAKVVSTAQTAYLISASKDAKLKVWKEKLGPDAPDALHVPEAVASEMLTIDGQPISIVQDPLDPAHSFLWIPSLRAALGGISVITGDHLWMADTASNEDLERWERLIGRMKSLDPAIVIPGHFRERSTSPAQLDFVRDYLTAYKTAAASSASSTDLVTAMTKRYPGLAGVDTLAFGAKVFKGEASWHVPSTYPPIGRNAEVQFGDVVFRLRFTDNKKMSFEGTAGPFKNVKDTVEYTPVEVAKNVFMVYWHEPSTGSNVVHVQDWNDGTAYTNIAAKDGSFMNLKGTIKLVP